MCGIAGYCGAEREAVLEKMAAALAHRGPDGAGFYHDRRVHLAHRRLAVIDLSAAAAQPLSTAGGELTVVFNGEIYNHRELRRELSGRGHRFQTDHADTEVLLHGYREWGANLPEKLDGMWAFAVHDRTARRLFCSRDRFGKKPFFYTRQNDVFAFASELTALRAHPDLTFVIDPLSRQKYFAYGFIPAPRSLYRSVAQIPAGHNLTLDLTDLSLRVAPYWDYVVEPQAVADEPRLTAELLDVLTRAVKKRLAADVPVGVWLSGGIDSSALAALAARQGRIATFSIGFTETSYDESPFAATVARHLNSDHHLTRVTEQDALRENAALLQKLDMPFADDSLLPTYLLARATRQHVTVALGGDGGDELFGGYEPLRYWQWAWRYRRYLPRGLHPAAAWLADRASARRHYLALSFKLRRFFRASGQSPKIWIPALLAPLTVAEIADLLGDAAPWEEIYSEAIAAWDSCASPHPVDKMTRYYVKLYLPDQLLPKVDRASMFNSLEVRSPFLDRDVADFARRLPAAYLVKNGLFGGGASKYLLKKALRGILPEEILTRPKQGFSPPAAQWWRTGELTLPPLRYGKPAFAARALAEHRSRRRDWNLYLWAQLALEESAIK
ncbi:asparagine synthetase B [Planctomycetales bacterium]|nr:asparagine synthetase B [Planctomycetales bacterium]GHT03530.1 asparagine synthetase B [Planctomycetales bacterium]